MLTVRVAARTLPETREAFIAQLRDESVEVPLRFEGCRRYAVWSNPDDPDEQLLYEEWESRSAFDAYRSSDYFAANAGVLHPLLAQAPDSAYFEASVVGP